MLNFEHLPRVLENLSSPFPRTCRRGKNPLTAVDRYAGDNGIAETQASAIIHALAHIYAPAPLAYTQETYPINGCTGLDTSLRLNNANNYVYLAAGKTTPPLFLRLTHTHTHTASSSLLIYSFSQ